MAAPIWKTTAGKIAIINEQSFYSYQLEAEDADSTSLTYSKIAGILPPGIELTADGLLQGVPSEVATRSLYNFVVRVSDGANIADRTFSLQVKGADAPVIDTPAGELDLTDSSKPTYKWILDGSYIEYQIEATDTDIAAGQNLVYDIASGQLPPGITMSTTGLISGTVLLTDDERYGPIGGYDDTYAFDDQPYDPTSYSVSRSVNYEFTVRVTDGVSSVEQVNSIFVYTADFWRVDNNRITVDQNVYSGFPLVMSLSANRRPVFLTPSNLGVFRHDNQCVIKIDVEGYEPVVIDAIARSLPADIRAMIDRNGMTGPRVQERAAEEVLARAALGAASSMITGDEPPAAMAESPGSAPTDPRLEVFRDFVNSLDPDLGGSRGGPAAD